MTILSITQPFPYFTTAAGAPLEAGFIYIGDPGYEARSKPKASFWDAAATIPTGTAAGGALRTTGGYPVYAGSAARVYVDGDYSITVLNSAGVLVYSTLSAGLTIETAGAITEVQALITTFSNTLTTLTSLVAEHEIVAGNFVQPARRLMPTGNSEIFASDDIRKTVHYCLSVGDFRIDCSGIGFGTVYAICVGPLETSRVILESGPGLVFVGLIDGRVGLDATAIELQTGESVQITKMRNNEIFVIIERRNPDVFSSSTGSPTVTSLYEEQPNGKYMLTHTRTLNASQVLATTTPAHPTRTMDFTNAIAAGSFVLNGAANTQAPFTLNLLGAGPSFGLVNPNASTTRCTIVIRNIDWSYT